MSEKNYAGYTEEEVAKSLKVIKDICIHNKKVCGCNAQCPFSEMQVHDCETKRICNISSYDCPGRWRLNPFPPKIWTPFRQDT